MTRERASQPAGPETAARISELVSELEREREARRTSERALLAALDFEQQSTARALHDTSSQTLNAARIFLRVLRNEVERASASVSPTWGMLEDAIQTAASDVESLLHWVRPARLDDSDLIAALTALSELAARTAPCEFHCTLTPPELDADGHAQQQLLRFAQQAVHALMRTHPPPLKTRLDLALSERELILSIHAWRVQALPGELAALLRARARSAGGTATADRAPEDDYRLTCRLPRPR